MVAVRSTACKAIHLKVYPRPANIHESRALLNVLQQFGEVTTYKSLRHDYLQPAPNTCLAIYRDAAAASNLIKASPLSFTLEPVTDERGNKARYQASQPTWDDRPRSGGSSDTHKEVPVGLEDVEFCIEEGPNKSGAEEMIRPSTLLYQTIDSFSQREQAGGPSAQDSRDSGAIPGSAQPAAASVTSSAPEARAVEPRERDDSTAAAAAAPATRVFHVVADVSEMNHRDYIERSFWFGPYCPRKRTASYADLTDRGVSPSIADVYMRKPEQPMRIVQALRQELSRRPTPRQIRDQGRRQRDEGRASSGEHPR